MYLNLNTELILKIIITLLLIVICILYHKMNKLSERINIVATMVIKELGALGYMSDSQKKLASILESVLTELNIEPEDPEDLKFEDPLETFKQHIHEQ